MVHMARSNSKGSSDEPEHPTSTHSSPSTSRRNTEPAHLERRNSRLGQVVDSIRHALAEEQEKIFGAPKPTKASIDAHLEHLRRLDRDERARVEREEMWERDAKESTSPALEARKSFDLNENGMGPDSIKEQASWGWPGLGSYPEPAANPAKVRHSSNGNAVERAADLEPRVEAAAFEAIDNAAESEAYGWPGVGEFPALKK